MSSFRSTHDDVMKWKHFPRYWSFLLGIHRWMVIYPHKGQWCGALMFSLICAWINGWVNNREAGHLGRHHAHYDVIVMCYGRLCRYCTDNCNNGYPKICTRCVVFCFVLATLQFFANWYGLSNHIKCDIIITLPIFLSQYITIYTP